MVLKYEGTAITVTGRPKAGDFDDMLQLRLSVTRLNAAFGDLI